jgi:hypothetical protein
VTETKPEDERLRLDRLLREPDHIRLRLEAEIVTDLVDRAFYQQTSAGVMEPGDDPVEHFCRVGWRMLRKPNPRFDVWWYWMNHLDPAATAVNPLVHYALIGREAGLSTRPESVAARPAQPLSGDHQPRRACLFAGFDLDGVVDEATLAFVTELSRHSDVFVLYDGYVPPAELAKLTGIAAGAWAMRHGAYDFGSYSMLARDLVGWDRLATYDEVLFVNDSCFLVRPLDDVFEQMDRRTCDWWGLQATKGLASTQDLASNRFDTPIPMDRVREELLATYEDDPAYDFHVGSYFLAFRRPVLEDPCFRALLDSVSAQPSKLLVILKYEVGLTHLLVGHGHRFDTFIPLLYPFHPLFTERHFALIGEGFPLLKRYLIYQNHYDIPGMHRWKEKVLEAAPNAPVDLFERSLLRSAPDDRLQHSLSIRRRKDGGVRVPRVIRGRAYRRRNEQVEKQDEVWAFAVSLAGHDLPSNSRAIFEAVKDDPSITKIVLTRSRRLDLDGANVVVEPLLSPQGRKDLLRAGRVFVDHRPRATLRAPVTAGSQLIVAVRDGLLLERTGRTAATAPIGKTNDKQRGMTPVHPLPEAALSGVLVASDMDALAAVASTWPATYGQAWRTGLPAHDFLFMAEEALPPDIRAQVEAIRTELAGRRLLLFLPSLRRSGTDREPYRFSTDELGWLRDWSGREDIAIGVREPDLDLERPYSMQLGDLALDLSRYRYRSLHAVLRTADILLTDYAGAALDFSITGKPVVSFTHDLGEAQERLLYDLQHIFPGPVVASFEALREALEASLAQPITGRHQQIRSMLVDHRDDANTRRVLAHLDSIVEGMR